jgi:hypothetical protein
MEVVDSPREASADRGSPAARHVNASVRPKHMHTLRSLCAPCSSDAGGCALLLHPSGLLSASAVKAAAALALPFHL